MKDNEFWILFLILFWTVTMLSVCALAIGRGSIYTSHVQSMADKDYVEQCVPGRVETIWIKP